MGKMLIAYYSWSNGNTKKIAEQLQRVTGADIECIDTAEPYEENYDAVVKQADDEIKRGFKPKIKPLPYNLEDYDVIAVGTPTWWYTMAPAVKTFLEENDFTGKTVIPFATHAGWPGHVLEDMVKACKGAKAVHEKDVRFDSSGGSVFVTPQEEIEAWLAAVRGSGRSERV
ncbi:flavodoxin [uncultured Selenomonas sp.]|uniref:flavodoxin n=1 Tax=uncultured Selenomonas sp. TaxID=159275 RepID=UPI0028E63CCE|nr:flavodoxin [uncultured Selenomonas sp.]